VPSKNQIRIIGGTWRGRRIRFPAIEDVRPTPDRVRETLFNWLGQDLSGAKTLDLFAGSGALSLEALSRGAALAVAIDRNRQLVRALANAGRTLGAAALETHCSEALHFLNRETRHYDVIFLDPPFAEGVDDALLAGAARLLAANGSIYVESPRSIAAPSGLQVSRRDTAGQVHYHLLRRINDA
jgi:16S rRNA (guanine(966)-N(2))-methyltransferase RsmD